MFHCDVDMTVVCGIVYSFFVLLKGLCESFNDESYDRCTVFMSFPGISYMKLSRSTNCLLKFRILRKLGKFGSWGVQDSLNPFLNNNNNNKNLAGFLGWAHVFVHVGITVSK